MSIPPGPDPNDYTNAQQVFTARWMSPAYKPQFDRAVKRSGVNLDRRAWVDLRFKAFLARQDNQAFRFILSSGDKGTGSHMLTQLATYWAGDTLVLGRQNRWRTLKLLRVALHAEQINPTHQIQLHSADFDRVLDDPRLQTVFEIIGISSAAENPPHLNRDWFGEPGQSWWPEGTSKQARALEIEIMEHFCELLEDSLGIDGSKAFDDAENAPGGAQGDNWRDTYSMPWDGKHEWAEGEYYDGPFLLVWDILDGRPEVTWPGGQPKGTLLLETPMPYRADFFAAPENLD